MEESEAQRMLRLQREWRVSKDRKSSGARSDSSGVQPSRTEADAMLAAQRAWKDKNAEAGSTKSRKPLLIGGLIAASLIGYGLLQGGGPSADTPNTGSPTSLFGFGRSAAADCRTLAGQPIEGGQDKFGEARGVSFATMFGPPAIKACAAATAEDPNDAASWRGLARAYIASINYAGFDKTEYSPKAIAAFEKAAELGDIPAATLVTILNFREGRIKSDILRDSQALAEKIRRRPLNDPQDVYYYAVLQTAIMELQAFYDARQQTSDASRQWLFRDDYKRSHAGQAREAFVQALAKAGGMPFFKEGWDLELMGVCEDYEYVCKLSEEAGVGTNDPRLFASIAASYLQEAYRIMDLRFRRAGNDEEAILGARNTGLNLASSANYYTELAEQHGGGQNAVSVDRLRKAHAAFRDHALERYAEADSAASKARAEAWTALAAVIVASALTTDRSDRSTPEEQSMGEYMQQLQNSQCEAQAAAENWDKGWSNYAIAKWQLGC